MSHQNPCPESIMASIPWYPGGLTAEERGAVESHAADCRECRAELAFLGGEEEPVFEVPDAEQVYARVVERIDALEAGAEFDEDDEDAEDALAVKRRERRQLLARARRVRQRLVQPVGIAAGLLVAVMSGMLTVGVIWVARDVPRYETVAEFAAVEATRSADLQIVFRPDATAAEIRTGLETARVHLVSGPTAQGVYGARLELGANPARAVKALRGEGDGVARFVESAPR